MGHPGGFPLPATKTAGRERRIRFGTKSFGYLRRRYQSHEARPTPPRTNNPVPGSGKLPPPPPPGGKAASAAEADMRPNDTASVRLLRIRILPSHGVKRCNTRGDARQFSRHAQKLSSLQDF